MSNLTDYLKTIADAIRSKKGTTEPINAQNFASEIESISGGGGAVIKTEGDWVGTAVPESGLVDKVYINTSLSVEEVVGIVKNLNYLFFDGLYVSVCFTDIQIEKVILIIKIPASEIGTTEDAYVMQCAFDQENPYYFQTIDVYNFGWDGWNPNITGVIDVNMENMITAVGSQVGYIPENKNLSKIFSVTPFIKASGESVSLTGEYDGSPIEVTEAGKVDIKALIDEKKIPLEVNVHVAGGVEVVDELPTENIQEGVIYQVNKISDVDVYSKVGAGPNYSIDNLETSIKIISGITPDIYYYVVDELPESPNASNFQTFTPAHIYIYNDVPYIYGDFGLGNMWVELIQLMNELGFDLQNKGYVNNKNEIQDAGVYVTYKLGEQGITSTQKYNLLINNNGSWNSVFKIKTLYFIKNYILTLEDGSTILTYYHQCSTEEIKDLLYFLQFSYVNEFSAILHSVMNIYGTELNLSASLASNLFFENDENLVSFYVGFNQMLIFKITNDNIIYLKEIRNLNFDILSTGITSNFSSQNKIKENIEFYNSIYISLPYI